MKEPKTIIIIVIAVILLITVTVFIGLNNNKTNEDTDNNSVAENINQDSETSSNGKSFATEEEDDNTNVVTPSSNEGSEKELGKEYSQDSKDSVSDEQAGQYIEFSGINNLPEGKNVIFFAASWCPSCRALDSEITKNIDDIPSGINILKADYDKETELTKEYSVKLQHTFVQVDNDGKLIKRWTGSNSLEQLLGQVQ